MLEQFIKNISHKDLEVFSKIKESSNPVILWGAGEMASYSLSYLRQNDIEPLCFCDNNPDKHGTVYFGLSVYSYPQIQEKFGSSPYNILIATGQQYEKAIRDQLNVNGELNPVYYVNGYEIVGEKFNYEFFLDNLEKFEEAYNSLYDDFSKKVFINVLNAKLSGDFKLYSEIKGECEYFDKEIVSLNDKEILLVLGAYTGNDICEFIRRTDGKYDSIIAFEPDPNTFKACKQRLQNENIERVEFHNIGAWYENVHTKFATNLSGSSKVSDGSTSETDINVELDSVDNILNGRRVSYIQMDVEGAECKAILGAEQTIRKWKPRMSVSIYHRREDLFDLLLLLKSYVPKYKFYLRHYEDTQTETVLYAIL